MSSPAIRPAILAAALLALPVAAAAVDPVSGLSATRSGNDLVIAWSPPPTAVDGYRVYRSTDLACGSVTLLYQGAATSYTVIGALADTTAALYAVAAYQGADESPRSAPVYKYPVVLPAPVDGTIGGRLVSLPHHHEWASSLALCQAWNGTPQGSDPLRFIIRSRPEVDDVQTKYCVTTQSPFDLAPQEAYYLNNSRLRTTMVWGIGDPGLDYRFDSTWAPPSGGPDSCEVGMHYVSLPYDHAYGDLRELGDEIPNAVRVTIFDTSSTSCGVYATGLSRARSTDPWSGSNVSLADRRGEGVVVAVDAPSTWRPRRQCTSFGGPTPPINQAPVADAGGPYDSALCNRDVIGIWLDGTASFDPDRSGPLRYLWTSTCPGIIEDPTAVVTPATFDCNVCNPLRCAVFLTVTDAFGLIDIDTEVVSSRQRLVCAPPVARGGVVVTSGGGSEQP